jgi:hypothetical protein
MRVEPTKDGPNSVEQISSYEESIESRIAARRESFNEKCSRLQDLVNRTTERNVAMSNIIKLTVEMRTAQKVYFDSLGQHSYHRTKLKNASKLLEMKLDALILRFHQEEAGHAEKELLLF